MAAIVIRLLIVGAIAVGVVAARQLLIWRQQQRLQRAPQPSVLQELQPLLGQDRPTVLAFSTPGCVECRSLQIPALKVLGERLADRVEIAYLSAPQHPELVDHFGIMTVPATVVLDAQGQPQHINLRYLDADRLQAQVLATLSVAEAA